MSSEEEIKKLDNAYAIIQDAESKFSEIWGPLKNTIQVAKSSLLNQANEISGLTDKQKQLLKEYEVLKEELEKFSRLAVSSGETVKIEDMQASLAIYRVLLEEIWQSQPHFRVLFLLHGDTPEMDVDRIKAASGVSGAMVLRACHELAKANLITFNIENKTAKLVKRLFPKREKH
jgi:hypothetical protein